MNLPDGTERGRQFLLWLSSGLLLLGAIAMVPVGNFHQPEGYPQFWGAVIVMGMGYALSWQLKSVPWSWFWGVAISTRLALLFMYPGDDIWRYLWEGYIQTQGFSPYDFHPAARELVPLRTMWWELINNRDTSAIYPPLTQLGFRGLALITPQVWLFKLGFAIADLGICGLLSGRFGTQSATLYAWSPVVIYAFAGGGHYDSWFILPLVLAWFYFEGEGSSRRWWLSAFWLGCSIAIKWISLPLLGFIGWRAWREWGVGRAIAVVGLGLLPMVSTALLFCDHSACPLIPTQSQFVASARSAELLPYFVEWVWPASRNLNWIFSIPLGLVVGLLLWRSRSFWQFGFNYFLAVFSLSPIIHIWYLPWWLPFATATQNWGGRLVSVSAFIYFILPYRASFEDWSWRFTPIERTIFWLPLFLGLGWSAWQSFRASRRGTHLLGSHET